MNHVIVFQDTFQLDAVVELVDEHLADIASGSVVVEPGPRWEIESLLTSLRAAEGAVKRFAVVTTDEGRQLHDILSDLAKETARGNVTYSDPAEAYLFNYVRDAVFAALMIGVGEVQSLYGS